MVSGWCVLHQQAATASTVADHPWHRQCDGRGSEAAVAGSRDQAGHGIV